VLPWELIDVLSSKVAGDAKVGLRSKGEMAHNAGKQIYCSFKHCRSKDSDHSGANLLVSEKMP
jgi:hypothetical protein